MSRSIKITDEVYQRIQRLQGPRESYSEVIARTLDAYETIQGIKDNIPATHFLQERPEKEEVRT